MAVPKKRTSRSKKKIRKSVWLNKTNKMALKALSLAKSILTNRSKSFHYGINNELANNFSKPISNNEE
uniref:Large ribosomal subunit protein bL32c n=1 Tax=Rhaphidolejeunea foliicola TaxID=2846791 RepID=A0A8F2XU07_9MARC|nr:ribosomal protein L32 [Rhaphidolejeunea foliicola]